MKQACRKFSYFLFAIALLAPAALLAQKDEKDKVKEKKETETIIITRNGGDNEKIVVEVVGDKVTLNGKPIEDVKGGNVTVRRSKNRSGDAWAYADGLRGGTAFNLNNGVNGFFTGDSNRAMLGVTTDATEGGVEVESVSKASAAEKAGLKEGDIIKKIGDRAIASPNELSEVVRKHKPGEKVDIVYSRDGKESKATAELGKWKGTSSIALNGNGDFNFNLDELNMGDIMPRIQSMPRVRNAPYPQNWAWSGGGGPKLGLSVQDTDDGKGVKVLNVDDESNAEKAGLQEEDVINEIDGKAVNSADEVAKIVRESKDKTSMMLKLTRKGKTQNVEVKIPRKLKTADL